ncbi:coiled-coil domain-containing protein [Holdemanella biformis]|uniref:coiled-coil domain-containing protein n=1 Tax=Holdemanella biformis TaxID=1735 RepID=UPI0022E8602E|nr:exodeoxyribonuclease VII small subunit [Holdemanella biformis]
MRSTNLLNNFAFKYVFGEDCKEANDALKSLLTVFLERKVVNVHVTNVGVDPILEVFLEFEDNTKMKLAILIDQNKVKLHRLSEYYLMRLFGLQKEYDLNPCQVIAFYDGKECEFEIDLQFRNDNGILFFPDGMLKISVYSTQNLDKSYDQMNDKEKMVYYFLNCRDKNKIKMIENDEIIQMLEKRVETISDDYWTKWIEDFRIQQENELKLEFEEAYKRLKEANKRLEEAQKRLEKANKRLEEANKRLEEAQKRLEEANKKVQEANKRADESDKLVDKMNQEMT